VIDKVDKDHLPKELGYGTRDLGELRLVDPTEIRIIDHVKSASCGER